MKKLTFVNEDQYITGLNLLLLVRIPLLPLPKMSVAVTDEDYARTGRGLLVSNDVFPVVCEADLTELVQASKALV